MYTLQRFSIFLLILCMAGLLGCAEQFDRLSPDLGGSFVKLHGGGFDQEAADVLQTNTGFLLLGTTYTASLGNTGDLYLVETDEAGNEIQSHTISVDIQGADGHARKMIRTTDQGFLICGTAILDNGHTDAWLIKLESNRQVQWAHVYGHPEMNESAVSMTEAANGDIFVAGTTNHVDILKGQGLTPAIDSTDVYLFKLDPNSPEDMIWEKVYGYSGSDRGVDIVSLDNGGVALLGLTDYPENGSLDKDVLLMLVNESGNVYHTMNIGEADQDEIPQQMLLLPNNQLLITGQVNQGLSEQVLFLTTNLQLELLSNSLSIPTSQSARANAIYPLENGHFLLCGSGIREEEENRDILLLEVDAEGNELAPPIFFGEEGVDEGAGVLQTTDGIVMIGTVQFGSTRMMTLIKTQVDGTL